MSPIGKRPRPEKPIPGKPIPGKPIPIPVTPIILWRSANQFRTSILHTEGQTAIYEGIDGSSYSMESKENGEVGPAISMGLSLPPDIKLRYVSFKYRTAGDSYIRSVSIGRTTLTGGYTVYHKGDLSLQSTDGTIYQTTFLENASTEGAITLSLHLMFPSKNKRISIDSIKIEVTEVEE